MKKRILALLVIALVLAACTPGNGGAEVVRIETLAYDQELAYIALSKNDVSGYNRWIPFYFVVQVAEGCSVDEVEDALSRHVREIRLFAKGGELVFSTEELIWSAFQLPGGVSNLSLVVIPECGALKCDGTVTLERLALLIDEKTVEFPISDYIIEEKETSSEKLAYSSRATMETHYTEDGTATADYGIRIKDGRKLLSAEPWYPEGFADITGFEILKTEVKDEGEEQEVIISVRFRFSRANPKTMFRPFVRVIYTDGEESWIIPTLPSFIT